MFYLYHAEPIRKFVVRTIKHGVDLGGPHGIVVILAVLSFRNLRQSHLEPRKAIAPNFRFLLSREISTRPTSPEPTVCVLCFAMVGAIFSNHMYLWCVRVCVGCVGYPLTNLFLHGVPGPPAIQTDVSDIGYATGTCKGRPISNGRWLVWRSFESFIHVASKYH